MPVKNIIYIDKLIYTMNNFSILLPYFIYNITDKKNNIYKSFISPGIIMKNGEYKDIYADTLSQNGWKKTGIFFGVNPAYKPIPNEMQLFKITLNNTFPYDIKNISLQYDIYNISNNYIYFITYTKPVINTIPLYIWENNNSTWVTFSSNSPDQKGWKSNLINPIYVIEPNIVGSNIHDIKFLCNDGVSMPSIPNQLEDSDIYNPTKHINPAVLHKSIVDCSQLIKINKPPTLLSNFKVNSNGKKGIILYIVGIIIFLILIGGLLYLVIFK